VSALNTIIHHLAHYQHITTWQFLLLLTRMLKTLVIYNILAFVNKYVKHKILAFVNKYVKNRLSET